MMLLLLVCVLTAPSWAASGGFLDLDKAVKVGDGPKTVIKFTDPDCPFCKKAAEYFRTRQDVTLYIFFYPLDMHPLAKAKVRYILSAPDRAKAYEEVMFGAFDLKNLETVSPESAVLQEEHMTICKANKVDATPTFMTYGRIIEGFNQKKLDELLK
jgi:thiol:disulfide interchange protein DsbC